MKFEGYGDLTIKGVKEKFWLKVEICERVIHECCHTPF